MSTVIGDEENGVYLRPGEDEVLDEIIIYIGGKCIVHMKATSAVNYWFGIYLPGGEEFHMNVGSKNLRSHVEAKAEYVGKTERGKK